MRRPRHVARPVADRGLAEKQSRGVTDRSLACVLRSSPRLAKRGVTRSCSPATFGCTWHVDGTGPVRSRYRRASLSRGIGAEASGVAVTEEEIITAVRNRAVDLPPPASTEAVSDAEKAIGYPLPRVVAAAWKSVLKRS